MRNGQKDNALSNMMNSRKRDQIKSPRLMRLMQAMRPTHPASWAAAIIGGIAGALAFDPIAWRALIVLAPLGCFLAIRWAPTPGAASRRAFVFGWIFGFGALHWLTTLVVFNLFAPLGIVLLGVYLGMYLALIAYVLRRWLWPSGAVRQFILFACCWLLIEWFRTLGRLALPLVLLGHAWATWPTAIQIAEWLGELGVSLEILWIAGTILFCSQHTPKLKKKPRKLGKREIVGVILTFIVPFFWLGIAVVQEISWSTSPARDLESHTPLRVAMLQPNVEQVFKFASYAHPDEKIRSDLSEQITALQEDMIAQSTRPDWDLLILPETAFTDPGFAQNKILQQRIGRMAAGAGCDMVFGAAHDLRDATPPEFYNSAYFVHADGTFDAQIYDKRRLVPFGECLPYFNVIPGLQEFVVGIMSFGEGKKWTLFETSGHKFATLICFESTFSSMARRFVARGAEFLVVITNDAWYGLSAGTAHHHNLSLLRAVETRRPVVRCANTGISSIVTPAGTISQTLELDKRGFVEGNIYLGEQKTTFFTRFGNLWIILPALAIGVFLGMLRRGRSTT